MTDFLCLGVQKFESVRGEKHNHLFNQDHGAENKTLSKNLKLLLQGERWKLHYVSRSQANGALNVIIKISDLTLKRSGSQWKCDKMGVTCLVTPCSRHGCCFTGSFWRWEPECREFSEQISFIFLWTILTVGNMNGEVTKHLIVAFFLTVSRGDSSGCRRAGLSVSFYSPHWS